MRFIAFVLSFRDRYKRANDAFFEKVTDRDYTTEVGVIYRRSISLISRGVVGSRLEEALRIYSCS